MSCPGFIFESYSYFLIVIFLLILLDKISSQVHILTSYCFCGVQWLRIDQYKGYNRFRAFFTWKQIDVQSPQKKIELGDFSRAMFSPEFLDMWRWGR